MPGNILPDYRNGISSRRSALANGSAKLQKSDYAASEREGLLVTEALCAVDTLDQDDVPRRQSKPEPR